MLNVEQVRDNPILRHSFELAVMIDEYTTKLNELKRYDLARQLFRSGTSIGANLFEGQQAESKNDFIHKLKIAAKESAETNFWLLLCRQNPDYPDCKALLIKLHEVDRLLSAIITTTKRKYPLTHSFIAICSFGAKLISSLAH